MTSQSPILEVKNLSGKSGGFGGSRTYVGLFLVTLTTLMYEILLTRIFSVTMWYHFAFVAISVALFGMTVGAITVYLFPTYFSGERTMQHLSYSALAFALTSVASLLAYLGIPYLLPSEQPLMGFLALLITFVVISVPFVCSGICVTLALTRFPRHVSKLYSADLAGAAVGCILIVLVLTHIDGVSAVGVIGFCAALGAFFFSQRAQQRRLAGITIAAVVMLAAATAVHAVLAAKSISPLRPTWVKGAYEPRGIYERWNAFSRIKVFGNSGKSERPFGWGLSSAYPPDRLVKQLYLNIDGSAGTVLTAFDGNPGNIQHLTYDVTNIAYYLRSGGSSLVIGAGGGRDVLTAIAFGQKEVVGVEMNRDIIDTVNKRFGDFTGHLDRIPNISFVADEARSYLARTPRTFSIIQISLIDTWAATAAGALSLTENSLYTVEAWKLFLERLAPDGILTVSRWYLQNAPAEMLRLTALAASSLRRVGTENPRDHIAIVRYIRPETINTPVPYGVGTILVSAKPFSKQDIVALEETLKAMRFELVLAPSFAIEPIFATIASEKNPKIATANYPLNISAPTDENPFFFHMLRLRDVFGKDLAKEKIADQNMNAVRVLALLAIVVVLLTMLCIIIPLMLSKRSTMPKTALPLLLYFAAIGLGFMFVEISQMQRLIIFLGHPTYALTVLLFILLLSGGLGSLATERIGLRAGYAGVMRLALLVACLAIFGALVPSAVEAFRSFSTPVRIGIASAVLFPVGFLMGAAFPLGMKVASVVSPTVTPWLWGVNGATSVCASVLAVIVALGSSISTAFWVGFFWYIIALLAYVFAARASRVVSIS